MTDSRKDKLEKLKNANSSANNMVIVSNSHEFIEAFDEKIKALRKSLDVDIGVDVDELIDELKKIDHIVPAIRELAQAIDEVELPELPPIPSTIEVKGLEDVGKTIDQQNSLLKAIDIPKTIDVKGLSSLEKAVARLSDYVKENTDKTAHNSSFEVKNIDVVTDKLDELVKTINSTAYTASQDIENYIPTRRVRLIGNRLIFDDDAWSGGGGGGGSVIQDNLITNDALKVVNPDGTNISGGGGSGNGAILDGSDSTIKASVLDYTGSNPLAVRLTDTDGNYVGAGAGTQYTEDAASAANPTGTQLIARRRDSLSSETTTDGDVTAVNSTAKGELYVKHVDAIPVTDNDGSLTIDATSLPLPTGASTAAKQPALGTAGTASADVITIQGIASMTAVKVDGSAVTQPVSGTVTSTPEKASSVTIARVATSTTNATLLSSNSSRKKAVIVNDSNSILYVKYGTTATATSYTYKLQSDDTLEETNYTGRIDGILDTGTGNAQTTDI